MIYICRTIIIRHRACKSLTSVADETMCFAVERSKGKMLMQLQTSLFRTLFMFLRSASMSQYCFAV